MALRGLSHPTTSRQGNLYGMIGMALAVLTTLVGASAGRLRRLDPRRSSASAIGGGVGAVIARRVPMTAMPQLVAAFHSLVGLAAVAWRRGAALRAAGVRHPRDRPHPHQESLFEMALGAAIGAITFTGSVIAFPKLDGRMSGKPIMLPQPPPHQHRASPWRWWC